MQTRRTLIERERERRELRGDLRRFDIEIEEYKVRLKNEKLGDLSQRKIESHIELLEDRKRFAQAMLGQIDLELGVIGEYLASLHK